MASETNAAAALYKASGAEGYFGSASARFVCPHCGTFAQHYWGVPYSLGVPLSPISSGGRNIEEPGFVFAACMACQRECLFFDGELVHPRAILAPAAHPDLPPELSADFEEARQISGLSARGAAALLRLIIQKLCPLIGAREGPIDKMIGQLVQEEKIPRAVQQAMDSVRVWGNEAVHPGTLDLRDDAAMVARLFGLVNFIVEKTISEPRQIAEIFGGLPAGKLEGIAKRDGR